MIHANEAMAVAGLSLFVVFGVGASIRHRLIASPRQVDTDSSQTPAVESGSALATVVHWKRRVRGSSPGSRALVIALIVMVGVLAIGPFPILLVLASWLSIGRALPLMRRRTLRRAIERELPGTIELLVLSIHAGLTPDQAVRELAHSANIATQPAFVEVVHRMDRGESLADALAALPQNLGPNAAGLAEVIGSASRYGLPLSQVLEQLSGEARSSRRRLDEAAARRLPVQLSFPLVVCTLPSFVLLTIAPAVIAALSSLGTSGL